MYIKFIDAAEVKQLLGYKTVDWSDHISNKNLLIQRNKL